MKTFKEKGLGILFDQILFLEHSLRWFLIVSPNCTYILALYIWDNWKYRILVMASYNTKNPCWYTWGQYLKKATMQVVVWCPRWSWSLIGLKVLGYNHNHFTNIKRCETTTLEWIHGKYIQLIICKKHMYENFTITKYGCSLLVPMHYSSEFTTSSLVLFITTSEFTQNPMKSFVVQGHLLL